MERFFRSSPILQINHKQPPFNDKYAYVTNVRWINGKLHIRTTTKTHADIKNSVISQAVAGKGYEGDEDHLDYLIATAKQTQEKLAMNSHYLEWGVTLPNEIPQSAKGLTLTKDGNIINLYRKFVDGQKAISKYNHHIAVCLANNFKPKQLGFPLVADENKKNFGDFVNLLEISSYELYLPVIQPLNNRNKPEFVELLNFITTRVATMEIVRHANHTNQDYRPGECTRLAHEDIKVTVSMFNANSKIKEHREFEPIPKPKDNSKITYRA